jgi:hypothetical protein
VTNEDVATVARQWVSHRTQMQARHGFSGGEVSQREFIGAFNQYAQRIGSMLPLMNQTEAEGFMELVIQWVSLRRIAESQFKRP